MTEKDILKLKTKILLALIDKESDTYRITTSKMSELADRVNTAMSKMR